uniref:CSON000261 protein n=1 Tax=Culicoides sonorensis TaxID=179676 RepID=A0A336ME54_CULSO
MTEKLSNYKTPPVSQNIKMAGSAKSSRDSSISHMNEVDRLKWKQDWNSPSASNRVRAIQALNTPNKNKRYSMFDVRHEQEELITAEERKAVLEQPPKTIQDVFAPTKIYVEVRSGADELTEGIKMVLRKLGAGINDTLTKATTHVVFKEGLLSTYTKAKKLGIPIVSVLWIEACKNLLILADPRNYTISNVERYENPELYKRIRRPKVMTPKLSMSQTSKFDITVASPASQTPKLTANSIEIQPKIEESSITTPKMTNRRQTIHIPTPRPIFPISSPVKTDNSIKMEKDIKTEPNMWAKAADNISRVAELAKQEKTPKEQVLDIFSPEKKEIIDCDNKPKVSSNMKRRTLYTPEPSTIKLSSNDTPKTQISVTESKTINKRRTLFTPEPSVPLPTVSKSAKVINRRRTLVPTTTPTKNSSNTKSVSKTPSKALQTVKNSFSTPSKGLAQKPSSISTKRKIEEIETKENTPPRPKIKPFLTPMEKTLISRNENHPFTSGKMKTEVAINKRRRTLYMTSEIGIKCELRLNVNIS